MTRRFLLWLTARLPAREIRHKGQQYLERYHLFTAAPFGRFSFRVQIHRFLASDPDGLHDHPFAWSFSVLLSGWYLEHALGGRRVVGRFNWVSRYKFHRIEVPAGAEVWTLFVHGPRIKSWGFLRENPYFIRQSAGLNGAARFNGPLVLVPASGDDEQPFGDWPRTARLGRDLRSQSAAESSPPWRDAA